MSSIRPKQLTDKPIPEAVATPTERRATKRGRTETAAGDTSPYEQYRAERAAHLQRQKRAMLRARLKGGAIKRAQRDREIAAEWDTLSDEVWRRDLRH